MRPLARFLRGKTLPRRLQRFRPESQHGELDQMLGESQAVLRQFGAEERLLPQRGRIPFIRGVTQSQRRRHAENRAESATGSEKRRRGSSGRRNPRGAQHQQLRPILPTRQRQSHVSAGLHLSSIFLTNSQRRNEENRQCLHAW